MLLDIEQYRHIKTESIIASSVGVGKALYLVTVVDGLDVQYEVRNYKKVLYSGKSSYDAAGAFNDAQAEYTS